MQLPTPQNKGDEQNQKEQLPLPTQAKQEGLIELGLACSKQAASTLRSIQASLEAAATGIALRQLPKTVQQRRAEQEAKAAQAHSKPPSWVPNPAARTEQRQAEQRPQDAAQCAEAHKPSLTAEESSLPRPLSTPLPLTPAPPPKEEKGKKRPR